MKVTLVSGSPDITIDFVQNHSQQPDYAVEGRNLAKVMINHVPSGTFDHMMLEILRFELSGKFAPKDAIQPLFKIFEERTKKLLVF